MAIVCLMSCARPWWKLRQKLRNLRIKIKRSDWIPNQWQTPDPLETRRNDQNLSNVTLDAAKNPTSRFLGVLPYEIRLQVYEYVLSDLDVLYQQELPLVGFEILKDIKHHPINCLWRIPGRLIAKLPYPNDPPDKDYVPHRLALLKTSKQIYAETIHTFYARATFVIQDIPVLFDLASTILPQRLASIRYLHLHFLVRWPAISFWWVNPKSTPDNAWMWARVWETIGNQMTGLRELSIYIRQFMWSETPNAKTERMVLEPLMGKLRGLEEFRLWYRHERVHDPFGDGYGPAYTYMVLGEECKEQEARLFRERLNEVVRKPKGWKEDV